MNKELLKSNIVVGIGFLSFVFFLMIQCNPVIAQSGPIKDGEQIKDMVDNTNIKVFNPETLSNPKVCEYMDADFEGVRMQGLPPLFGGVKDIYIFNSIKIDFDGSTKQKFEENKLPNHILREDRYRQIEEIAGCILYERAGGYKYPEKFGKYIYTTMASASDIYSSIDGPGDLSIFISGYKSGIHKKYKKYATKNAEAFESDLYVLNVRFYRPDVTSDFLRWNFCSLSFPYTEDKDLFKRLITRSLQSCLQNQYH